MSWLAPAPEPSRGVVRPRDDREALTALFALSGAGGGDDGGDDDDAKRRKADPIAVVG